MKPAMELGILNREGMKALSKGQHANALFILKQALARAGCFKTRLNEAKVRNNIGLAILLGGNAEEAKTQFRRALDIVEADIGTENHLYRRIAGNLAAISPCNKEAQAA